MTELRNVSPDDRGVLEELRREIDQTFDVAIGSPRRVALLQYPYDGNVGNHMMWLETAQNLRRRGIRIAYAAHTKNFDVDRLAQAVGDDPILFIGGVTMSRLWPEHTRTKQVVASRCRRNRLVSLASTMLFTEPDDEHNVQTMFDDHPDVTLVARDPLSADHASRVFGDRVRVLVQHDCTLNMTVAPRRDRVDPEHRILWLQRDDAESTGVTAPPGVHVFDWPSVFDDRYRRAYVPLRVGGVLSRSRRAVAAANNSFVNRALAAAFTRASDEIVAAGIRMQEQGRVLVTDRMHPHILAVLIGQPVVLLPDKYGKNRAVYDYSTSRFGNVRWADTADEALQVASELASGQ